MASTLDDPGCIRLFNLRSCFYPDTSGKKLSLSQFDNDRWLALFESLALCPP